MIVLHLWVRTDGDKTKKNQQHTDKHKCNTQVKNTSALINTPNDDDNKAIYTCYQSRSALIIITSSRVRQHLLWINGKQIEFIEKYEMHEENGRASER